MVLRPKRIRKDIVANLVDRLMEGVPDDLTPTLEAAAVVRWFDQSILRNILKQEDVRDAYNDLRKLPFVRTCAEGLALHDVVREAIDENLRTQDSDHHSELHKRAAIYFENLLEKATSKEFERLGLERLYHRARANEDDGIRLFQEMAKELVLSNKIDQLKLLLTDVSSYLDILSFTRKSGH